MKKSVNPWGQDDRVYVDFGGLSDFMSGRYIMALLETIIAKQDELQHGTIATDAAQLRSKYADFLKDRTAARSR